MHKCAWFVSQGYLTHRKPSPSRTLGCREMADDGFVGQRIGAQRQVRAPLPGVQDSVSRKRIGLSVVSELASFYENLRSAQ